MCKFRGFIFFLALGCPIETPREIASKGPSVVLEFGKLLKVKKKSRVLNKVYAYGNTDQPFTFSWAQCKTLASCETALLTLSPLLCCRYSLLPISQQSRCPCFRSCLFLISSECLAQRWNTRFGFHFDVAALRGLKAKMFVVPTLLSASSVSVWIVI